MSIWQWFISLFRPVTVDGIIVELTCITAALASHAEVKHEEMNQLNERIKVLGGELSDAIVERNRAIRVKNNISSMLEL